MNRMSAFEYYLRTGRRLADPDPVETKFNPWHDPEDGRFTFAGQGRRSGDGGLRSRVGNRERNASYNIRSASLSANPRPSSSAPISARQPGPNQNSAAFIGDLNQAAERMRRETDVIRPVLRSIPGYSDRGASSWRAANDRVFIEAASRFNTQHGLKPGDPKYIDPLLIKAWAMVESGGSESAFLRDPLQVNNPGDWQSPKPQVTGLIKDQRMTPTVSAVAALKWLEFKGYIRDGQGRPGPWIGFERALQRYNGKKTFRQSGIPQNIWYAREVMRLFDSAKSAR